MHSTASFTTTVLISRTVIADLDRRGVFPTIRPQHAARDRGATGCEFTLSRACASALVEDAIKQGQVRRGMEVRGLTLAYNSMSSKIMRAFRWHIRYSETCLMQDGSDADLDGTYADTAATLIRIGMRALPKGRAS